MGGVISSATMMTLGRPLCERVRRRATARRACSASSRRFQVLNARATSGAWRTRRSVGRPVASTVDARLMACRTSPSSMAVDPRCKTTFVGLNAVQSSLRSPPIRRANRSASDRNSLAVLRSSARAAAMEPASSNAPYTDAIVTDGECISSSSKARASRVRFTASPKRPVASTEWVAERNSEPNGKRKERRDGKADAAAGMVASTGTINGNGGSRRQRPNWLLGEALRVGA